MEHRTVKVTGFSLKPAIRHRLNDLFSRVAQVQKVDLSRDRNSAFVRFEYKSAVQFVFDQEWLLDGDILRVHPVVPSRDSHCLQKSSQAQQTAEAQLKRSLPPDHQEPDFTFSSYCRSRNQFWVDVPHEQFAIPCRQKKRKRCFNVQHQSLPGPSKRPKKKKKKQKKVKCAYLEPAVSVPFGVTTLPEKCPLDAVTLSEPDRELSVREIFIKGNKTAPASLPQLSTAADVRHLVAETTGVPSELLHITIGGRTLTDKVASGIVTGTTLHYSVRGRGGMHSGEDGGGKLSPANPKDTVQRKEEEFQRLKEMGNSHVKKGEFTEAASLYTQCLDIFKDRAVILTNRAHCYLKLDKALEAEQDCTLALSLEPTNVKALYRRGMARKMQGKYKQGLEDQLDVLHIEPKNKWAKKECDHLKTLCRQEISQGKETPEAVAKDDCAATQSGVEATPSEQESGKDGTSRGASSLEPTCDRALARTASEEDVMAWLCQICGLQEAELQRFHNIDGDMIFEYTREQMIKHTGVPLGCTRKVLYLRDNPSLESKMLSWGVADVIEFIRTFDKSGQSLAALERHHIDGPALLSYQNAQEIEEELGLSGTLAFKIQIKRDKEDARTVDTVTKVVHIDNSVPFARYRVFVQDILHLQPVQEPAGSEPDSLVKCDLKIIVHKEKGLNELEKCFQFLILCRREFSEFNKERGTYGDAPDLFDAIRSHVHDRWIKRLPDDKKKLFLVDSKSGKICHKGEEVTFKNARKSPPKLIALRERSVENLHSFCTTILFVDKHLLEDQCSAYVVNMGSRKKPENFAFGFDKQESYCFFDSKNLQSFSEDRIGNSQAGAYDRCKLQFKEPDEKKAVKSAQSDEGQPEKSLTPEGSRISNEPKPLVRPRGFKRTDVGAYEEGVFEFIETADGMIDPPCREFKFHGNISAKESVAKRAFLLKALRFACGCLNSRRNGTIYFGVSDKYRHCEKGEITGVEMTKDLQDEYYKIFRSYLLKVFPHQEDFVKLCVLGPYFVWIRNSSPRKCVIEIDVEPDFYICQDTLFKLNMETLYEDFGTPAKEERQKEASGVFIRDIDEGTREPATLSLDSQGIKDFQHDHLMLLAYRRQTEEEKWKENTKRKVEKLEKHKFQTFMAECDRSRFPILVISKPTAGVKENMHGCLDFVPKIKWAAIMDFDSDSDKDGLYSMCTNSESCVCELTEVPVKDFVLMPVDERRAQLDFPIKTPYVFANGKSTGDNQFDSLDPAEWKKVYFPMMRTAVSFFQDPHVIDPHRRLILTCVSEEAADDVLKACDDIVSAFGWENVFFVFDSETQQSKFMGILDNDLLEHSAVLSWRDAQCIIEEVLEFLEKDREKYVCTASGALIKLPSDLHGSWKDLDVLSARECEEYELTSPELWEEEAKREEERFYCGGKVSWLNLYFEDHVIERTILSDLKKRVTDLCDGKGDVPRVILGHMPGTGGTTLVRHLLWGFRKEYKCAVLCKIRRGTERHVREFWEAVECVDKEERKPVILIADNITNDDSETDELELCRVLYRQQKIERLLRPLAIVVICQRQVKVSGDFCLREDVDDEDKRRFQRKHKKMEGVWLPSKVDTFLGFLSLRCAFDPKTLQDKIFPYLNSEILGRKERELIIYLSLVMVYFPSSLELPGIPVISCDKLMYTIQAGRTPWEKQLSMVAKYLLVTEDPGFRSSIVRIPTYACAQAILTLTLQDFTLGNLVICFLKSDLVTEESPASQETKMIVKKILTERQRTESGENVTHMSPLIMEIQAEGHENEIEVLNLGERQLKDTVFYQQLARLYLKKEQFEKAKECGETAVSLSPDIGEYKHTLGSVYLKMFENAKTGKVGIENHIEKLNYAFESLENFVQAQEGDDAISISYAFCDAIKVINQILWYMEKRVLKPEQLYDFGCYLTQPEFCITHFEVVDSMKTNFKRLIGIAQTTLCFMFYLGFSYRNTRGRDSVRQERSKFAISYVKKWSVKEFDTLARVLGVLVHSPGEMQVSCNALRIENMKLCGSFFESIMYYVLLYNTPGTSDENKCACGLNLEEIRDNLWQIPEEEMLEEDIDNFITVSLALQLIRKNSCFTREQSDIYTLCNNLIERCTGVLRKRAHLYRVLVSWPRREDCGVFNAEHFKSSFYNRGSILRSRNEPLSPRVHFFIARSSADFHICHWAEIYHQEEEEGTITTLQHQLLEPFVGTVVVSSKHGKTQTVIDMDMTPLTDQLPGGLKVRGLRNEGMLNGQKVKFYLGFSLQGPVAYIYE